MNKTISLAAIAMVAVIMGMSAFAPAALADRPYPGDEKAVCHFDRDTNDDGDVISNDDRAWEVLTPNNHGASHGHQGHGDLLVPSQITEVECLAQLDPDL